jgi:hypothetical protein
VAKLKTATRVISNAGMHRVIGHSPSQKNRFPVVWESLIERDYFLLLEHDPRVVRYIPQPETIQITVDPRWESYTPDVLVFYANGTLCRVEVKPDEALSDPELEARLEMLRVQYLLEGKDFRVVTASDIRIGARIENLRALRHYTRVPLDEPVIRVVRSVLEDNTGIRLNCAADLIAKQTIWQPLAVLYHLMFRQQIAFDLDGALVGPKTALYWRQS